MWCNDVLPTFLAKFTVLFVQRVATIYTNTHLRTHWNRIMGLSYSSSESFMVIRIQNV